MLIVFTDAGRLADERIFFQKFFTQPSTMLQLPRIFIGGWIIFVVYHIAAALQHERLQSFFTKFFGSPASGYTRADDNRIVGIFLFAFHIEIDIAEIAGHKRLVNSIEFNQCER